MGFVLELAILPSFMIAYILRDRGKYDVFIAEGHWAMVMGYILKKTGRVRLFVSDDYDYSPGSQPISAFRRWYTNLIEVMMLKKSDLVFSVGELLAALRSEQTGKSVEVVPNGVDYALFNKARKQSERPPTLIYTGGVEGWSGLDVVIKALKEVREKISDIRLLIIGHGSERYEEELRGQARSYSLEKNICFLGMKKYTELPAYMGESDIGLAMYMPIDIRKYGFSLKVIEYMSAGLPVITTKATQSAIVVDGAEAGLTADFEPGSVASAILKLLEDREFYKKCSARAVKKGSEYEWKSIMERCYLLIKDSYGVFYGD